MQGDLWPWASSYDWNGDGLPGDEAGRGDSARRPTARRRARVGVVHPVLCERSPEAVLVQAVADDPVAALESRDVIDDAVLAEARDLVDRLHEALHDERPLVHAVAPIGFHAVARADRDEGGEERGRGDREHALRRVRKADRR